MMTVASARDLAIIITSIISTGILIYLLIIVFLVYRRVRRILDSVEEVSLALRRLKCVVTGVVKGIDFVSRIFEKEKTGGGKKQ